MLRRSLFLRSIILCLEGRTSTSQVFYRRVKNVCSLLSTFCSFFFFTLWSVPDFLLDVHYFCSLLVNRYFLVIDCCFLLIACYSLLVGLYFLLVTFYSLLVTFYCFSFLSARCMLLVFLLVASYFFRYIFFFALVFTYFAYLTIQRKIDGHVLNCLL